MKPGFYISMGVAVAALVVGFVLLNDIQQEKDAKTVWIQKIPTQCNDVWNTEYNEYYQINPEMKKVSREESKAILDTIIKNHYENQGIRILDLNLDLDYYDGVRCEACSCLGWDRLSIQISQSDLEKIPASEGWEVLN
ncbi:MAG: hypothetical protein PVG77_07120 [Nitrosopumilaceae archaeon]|jgi:hypothetical protein